MIGYTPQHAVGRYMPAHARAGWIWHLADRIRARWERLMGAEPYEDDDEFMDSVGPFLPDYDPPAERAYSRGRLDELTEQLLFASSPAPTVQDRIRQLMMCAPLPIGAAA